MKDLSIEIEEALINAFRTFLRDEEGMRRLALANLQWLSVEDLTNLTGYSPQTIDKWRGNGWIRMFLPGDSREYRTTLEMWKEDQAILIEAGLLNGRGQKPTIDERKRRISELQRQRLRHNTRRR